MKPEICVEVHAKYIFLAYKRPPGYKKFYKRLYINSFL